MDERTRKIGAYAVLYLVWGSTYLAMRMAVETLPPFSLACMRFLVSGLALLGFALARGDARPGRRDWLHAAVVGALLLIGGNALVIWAVQHVPSGVAALVVATTPLWLAILSGKRPSMRVVVGIVVGLVGIGVLVGPAAFAGTARIDPRGVAVLVVASLSWAAGSLVQRKASAGSPLMGNGLQMVCGGLMLLALAVGTGELHDPSVFARASLQSWLAVVYLAVFGSLLGFTSYAWLMRHDDPARVATYAYVNPVVAVILGALIGGEALTLRVLVAAAIIVSAVVVIVTGKR